MKTGIITHYNVHNHGAHLQLYALAKQLKKLGYSASALRYKKNYDFLEEGAGNKYQISLRSISVYAKYLLKNGFARTMFNYTKRKGLRDFRKQHCLVGEFYSRSTGLDAVVIGSDEIFSIEPGLNPCFWGMGVPCSKIISYAASFGPTTMDFIGEHNAESFVKGGIDNIDVISVRDKNSQNIIRCLGGKDVPIVCDPVLLYDFSEELAASSAREKPNTGYCVVYSYDYNMNDDDTVCAIKEYAKKNGLKVYSIGFYHKWCDKNIQADPLDLLFWFKDAQMVFTDTFHGCVISLAVGTQFLTQVKANVNKLGYLLEQYGVQNRRVNRFSEMERVLAEPINYEIVNQTIRRVRADSMDYLVRAMGEGNASM